jgi:hypothetical protein
MKIFKGKKAKVGPVHTMDIELDHIRAVFFPKNFWEKYHYLGSVPYGDGMSELKALVVAMDHAAKPWWCPRWFLRFLHLFGSDNSIVRVRNQFLHNLEKRLTSGIMMWDYKTKWSDYDLRISISAPQYLQNLADAIEQYVYRKGYKAELIERIKVLQPDFKESWKTTSDLQNILAGLQEKEETSGGVVTMVHFGESKWNRRACLKLVDDRVVFDCSDEEYGPIDFGINELVKQLDAHQKLTKP